MTSKTRQILADIVAGLIAVAIVLIIILVAAPCKAGDTYDCINSKGDYINYGPAATATSPADPRAVIARIVVASDSARYEQRWQPMLDPNDLRSLIFTEAKNHPYEYRLVP